MRKNTLVALLTGALVMVGATFWASPASAQGRRGGRMIISGGFYSPFYYDPFWGPYPYYGYGAYPIGARSAGEVRVLATPKQAEVLVDGFYAGVVDDFDGTFQRLHTTPGGHAIIAPRRLSHRHAEHLRDTRRHLQAAAHDGQAAPW